MLCSLQRLQGRILSLTFPASRGHLHSLAHGPHIVITSHSDLPGLSQKVPFPKQLIFPVIITNSSCFSYCFEVPYLSNTMFPYLPKSVARFHSNSVPVLQRFNYYSFLFYLAIWSPNSQSFLYFKEFLAIFVNFISKESSTKYPVDFS